MELSKKQIKYLKAQAHHLTPTVTIGEAGVTSQVMSALDEYLCAHELVKIKIWADEREDFFAQVQALQDADESIFLVSTIGRMAVFYRPFADEHISRKNHLKLPSA